jgi:membrane-bound lytic murein transglycosylase D
VPGAALARRLLIGVVALLAAARLFAAEDPMLRPPELERDVQFWIRVYTEVDTNGGFLHDEHDLAVVYDTLHFAPNTSPHEREKLVEQGRDHYAAALRRIAAANGGPLSPEDQHILDMWGSEGTPARLLEATDEIRFQLGQADRFRAGLIRSGAWETHIAETLANLGLPAELAVLPHVESSFNPAARSKVGAAGLWQFMRSTGRRYMRIDGAVDDRMDPFRSTEAAAQLLAYNYRLLGTWPLALTAYNHGAEGVRRAKEALGTDDIVTIVRKYKSRTFGFASRNFYVSFLAALDIDHNPEKYFGSMERTSEARFQEVVVPAYVPIASLERVLHMAPQQLRDLNPALLRPVWDGQRHVPKAYHLRLPLDGEKWTSDLLAEHLRPGELYAGQPTPRRYRIRTGDTIESVAEQNGFSPETLARLNRLRTSAKLHVGRSLTLPEVSAATLVAAASQPPAAFASSAAARASSAPIPGTAVAPESAAPAQTPRAAAPSGERESTAGTGAKPSASAPGTPAAPGRKTPASVPSAPAAPAGAAAAGVYVVQRGESLSDIASKFGMTEAQLLQINGIRNRDFIFEGQQLTVNPASPALASAVTAVPSAANTARSSTAPTASTAVPSVNTPSHEQLTGALPLTEPAVPVVAGGAVSASVAERESAEESAAVATTREPTENAQPVSAEQAEALSPALGPSADTQQNADPIDYSVGKDGTIAVAAAETLGHYADWLGTSAARLRQVNRMKFGRPVLIGHRIKLQFNRVSREDFEARRRQYHEELQAAYFAAHRIIGTEVYIVRRGDSLWTVTQRFVQLPIWLLQQYNPDVDLADLHPGTQITMPRVEIVVPGPS